MAGKVNPIQSPIHTLYNRVYFQYVQANLSDYAFSDQLSGEDRLAESFYRPSLQEIACDEPYCQGQFQPKRAFFNVDRRKYPFLGAGGRFGGA